jgi:hypothetical protein
MNREREGYYENCFYARAVLLLLRIKINLFKNTQLKCFGMTDVLI